MAVAIPDFGALNPDFELSRNGPPAFPVARSTRQIADEREQHRLNQVRRAGEAWIKLTPSRADHTGEDSCRFLGFAVCGRKARPPDASGFLPLSKTKTANFGIPKGLYGPW
jgi:hypothetical protein